MSIDYLTTNEIYDMGYALATYDMMGQYRYWRFRGEEIAVPANSVPLHELAGAPGCVGKIEDVRKASHKRESKYYDLAAFAKPI